MLFSGCFLKKKEKITEISDGRGKENTVLNTFTRSPLSKALKQQQTYPQSMSNNISKPLFTDHLAIPGHKVGAASSPGIKTLYQLPSLL